MFVKNLFSGIVPALLAAIVSLSLNAYSPIIAKNWIVGLSILFVFCFILNLIYASHAASDNFTQLLIAAIVIKLVLALSGVVVYSLIDGDGFFHFSLHFILHYVLFTIFEIRYLLYLIKKNPLHAKIQTPPHY